MLKKILLLITITFFTACSVDKDNPDCCTIIDTKVTIKYVNQEGENLFEIENGFNQEDVNIYHKINNEWEKFHVEFLDYPRGFMMVEREDGTYLAAFTSRHIVGSGISETRIEFAEDDSDVIRAEIERNGANEKITKVWYNDELKWEEDQTERMFEIVK